MTSFGPIKALIESVLESKKYVYDEYYIPLPVYVKVMYKIVLQIKILLRL